jgi:hypothetical protein
MIYYNYNSYKEIEMHREDLLEWLKEYMVDNPTSVDKLAGKIGFDRKTLTGFLRSQKETSLECLLKIEKFLKEQE